MSKTDRAEQAFTGFPEAALDFYDDLELDNTRSFWAAHKHVYDEAVRAPMLALTAALADEFGTAKVFRPYRDVRFAKDKTPYKNHQGAFVAVGPATGWYVEIGSPGVRVGAGYYRADSPDLARIRAAIDTEHSGQELERHRAAAEEARLRGARGAAEDLASWLLRRPSADRAVALHQHGARQVLRLREVDPHARPARSGAEGLASPAPARRVGGRPGRRALGG